MKSPIALPDMAAKTCPDDGKECIMQCAPSKCYVLDGPHLPPTNENLEPTAKICPATEWGCQSMDYCKQAPDNCFILDMPGSPKQLAATGALALGAAITPVQAHTA